MMRRGSIVAMAAPLAMAACVAGPAPDIATPEPDLPRGFQFEPPASVAASVADLLPSEDPAFAALSTAALERSPNLREALARIEAARAAADRAGAERLPALGIDSSIQGSRSNPDQFGANLPAGVAFDSTRVRYGANLTAAWDPDLFGRLRASERAALARIDASSAEAGAVRLSLLAEIAAAVVDWRTLEAREAALRSDLAAAQELARLAGVREDAGIAPGFDRIRAESAAAASQSRIDALDSERGRLMGRLVTLTAVPAAEILAALAQPAPIAAMPPAPPSLPSELLTNRPDIRAASARLAASDAELAATAARRFPRFDLSATLGLLAFGIGGLFDSDAVVGSLGAGIAAPLFDFGRIQAEIDASAADKRAAFERYRGAVYSALGEAETAYALVAAADREALATASEADLAARQVALAETRYRAGLSDFLTVLEARRAADGSRERAAAAQGRARRARILLWQALGGGAGGASGASAIVPGDGAANGNGAG